ncbi:MAG: Hsp70 family protein [Planctomycetaceae bacterium]
MNQQLARAVGIDLGTTYSALACMDPQGIPRIVQDSAGQAVTPSVVFFDDDEVLVGDIAVQQSKLRADRVVQFVKTHMGDEWTFDVNGQTHTPESISGIILAHLIREAEPELGIIQDAVITVPAYFTEKRRRATQQAGEIAGLNVMATLNEPISAALAYGLYQQEHEQIAVVYDLGGGTFDVTVVRVNPNGLEELATIGNRKLGGKDWDQCLVEHVAQEFQQQHGSDPHESLQAMQDLQLACEQAKRRLGRMKSSSIRLNAHGRDHVSEVTREQFELMTAHLLQTTKLTTQMALEDVGLNWSQVHRVVLVGGSTHMPMVGDMLREISGLTPDSGVNPILAVALGAAHYAYLLESGSGPNTLSSAPASEVDDGVAEPDHLGSLSVDSSAADVDQPAVRFVTAHGVGIKVVLRFRETNMVLIHKNTPVPCTVRKQFRTVGKQGSHRTLAIVVTQGDTPNMELAEVLGTGRIEGLPENEPAGEPVEITMIFDDQGRLTVRAVYVKTGQQLTINLQIPGGLAEDDVLQYKSLLADAGLIAPIPTVEDEKKPLPQMGYEDLHFDDVPGDSGDPSEIVSSLATGPASDPVVEFDNGPVIEIGEELFNAQPFDEVPAVDPAQPVAGSVADAHSESASDQILGLDDLEIVDDENQILGADDLEIVDDENQILGADDLEIVDEENLILGADDLEIVDEDEDEPLSDFDLDMNNPFV